MLRQKICIFSTKPVPVILLAGALCGSAQAEPVKNRVLSDYQVQINHKCLLYKINFNHRIRYVSHFPTSTGSELRIVLQPIDRRQFDLDGGLSREALRPPQDYGIGIKAIQYEEAIAEAPTLTVIFARPVSFDATGGSDFQSLVFSVTDTKYGKACKPVFPAGAADPWQTVTMGPQITGAGIAARRPSTRVTNPGLPVTPEPLRSAAGAAESGWAPVSQAASISGPTKVAVGATAAGAADTSEIAAGQLIAEARTALKQGDLVRAIAQLKKTVELPENRRSPEARELLGVAYQKDRQLAAAKSVYEDYLSRYQNSEGSEGVRQRLLAMETADAPPSKALRAPTIGPSTLNGGAQGPGNALLGGSPTWNVSGSVSTTYISNDTHSVMRDPTLALNLNSSKDDHQIHQNTLLSSFDLFAIYNDANVKSRFRFSGTEEHRMSPEERDITGVGAFYLDATIKDWDTAFSIGRQTRNTGGILGRFDGAVVTYKVNPLFNITAVAGSPAEYRSDSPFKNDRYFYGGSVNVAAYYGLDASVYAIEQMDRAIVDRQAVGTELRYNDSAKSAFLNLDYDAHFNQLDAAIFTGTWTLADKSVLRVGADYRKAPYLTTWNALQGQPYGTLYDILKAYTQSELQQMAIDRTATYQSATAGYSPPLTDNLQLNLDFTQAHIDGTITSYNVNGTPDTGDEYYYSAQLVGTSLFTQNDLYTAAFRYSNLKDSNNYAIDLSTRYFLTEDLRVQPRFVGGQTVGKTTSFNEYAVSPSVLFIYTLKSDLNFEIEVGERSTWRTQGTTRTSENEFTVTAGIRLDFYADSQNCLIRSVFCRASSQAAK
jgi:hypothetical protein